MKDVSPDKKAIVLVSGGVESSILMAEALDRYEAVYPVYIRKHLRWEEAEIFWLKNFHRWLRSDKLQPIKVLELPMREVYDRHWSITGIKVPGAASKDESMYLPGRNILFLAKAGCYAAIHNIPTVEIGVLKGNPFTDSSRSFFDKMSEVLSIGLNRSIKIDAPFRKMNKEEVLLRGKHFPLEFTFSCINPKNLDHCGDCNKCTERKKAFFSTGIFDKTKYKKRGIE